MWRDNVRKAIEHNKLNRDFSTRTVVKTGKLLSAGYRLKEVKDMYTIGWSKDEKERVKSAMEIK